MKNINVVFKVARQIDGEYVFVTAEKAFTDSHKAEAFWREKSRIWREEVEGVSCECERAIHVVELEE